MSLDPGYMEELEKIDSTAKGTETNLKNNAVALPRMKSKEMVKFEDSGNRAFGDSLGKQKIDMIAQSSDDLAQRKSSGNEQPGALEASNPGSDGKSKGTKQKSKKPAWSRPADEQQGLEKEEDEELLEYMGNLDLNSYVEDVEIKNLMESLKARIESLKQEPDWREKWKLRLKEKTEKRKQEYLEQKEKQRHNDDNISVVASNGDSKASFLFGGEAQSIASSKTQGNKFIPVSSSQKASMSSSKNWKRKKQANQSGSAG